MEEEATNADIINMKPRLSPDRDVSLDGTINCPVVQSGNIACPKVRNMQLVGLLRALKYTGPRTLNWIAGISISK